MLATDGLCPLRLPVGMIRSGWICSTDSPFAAPAEHGVQHVLGNDWRPAAVLALACRGVEPFQGRLPDVLPLGLRHRCEEREERLPRTGGVVDAGQGSGQHL